MKKHSPETIVFSRGEFSETFDDDAILVLEACSVSLTARELWEFTSLRPFLIDLIQLD